MSSLSRLSVSKLSSVESLSSLECQQIDFMYSISVGGWESGRCDADGHTLMHTDGVLSNSMKYSAWLSQIW